MLCGGDSGGAGCSATSCAFVALLLLAPDVVEGDLDLLLLLLRGSSGGLDEPIKLRRERRFMRVVLPRRAELCLLWTLSVEPLGCFWSIMLSIDRVPVAVTVVRRLLAVEGATAVYEECELCGSWLA